MKGFKTYIFLFFSVILLSCNTINGSNNISTHKPYTSYIGYYKSKIFPEIRWFSWSFYIDNETSFSSPPPTEGTVFCGSDDFYAIDAKTGQEKWKFKTGNPVSSSPAVIYKNNHLQ